MKNSYLIDGEVVKIFFRKCDGYFLIDKEDLEKFQKYTWYFNSNGYAESMDYQNKHIKAHHIVIGHPPQGLVTDHINRNRLDNRKSNLRFVTPRENSINRSDQIKLRTDSSSMLGIRIYKGKKKTSYYIQLHDKNNKIVHLGKYANLEEALLKRDIEYKKLRTGEA